MQVLYKKLFIKFQKRRKQETGWDFVKDFFFLKEGNEFFGVFISYQTQNLSRSWGRSTVEVWWDLFDYFLL